MHKKENYSLRKNTSTHKGKKYVLLFWAGKSTKDAKLRVTHSLIVVSHNWPMPLKREHYSCNYFSHDPHSIPSSYEWLQLGHTISSLLVEFAEETGFSLEFRMIFFFIVFFHFYFFLSHWLFLLSLLSPLLFLAANF